MKPQCLFNLHVVVALACLLVSAFAANVRGAPPFLTSASHARSKVSSVLQGHASVQHVDIARHQQGGTDANVVNVDNLVHIYNKETPLVFRGKELGVTIEGILAGLFVCMIACVPLAIAMLEAKPSKIHYVQSAAMMVWLVSCLFLFTHVVQFQSVHFSGMRPLTLVETIYLMAQVLTTVGHGDITPATPNAQVAVGLYVFFTILLIADMVSAVVNLAISRTQDYTKKLTQYSLERQSKVARDLAKLSYGEDVIFLHHERTPLPWYKFFMTWSVFLALVVMGVLFYHYFPGENKSWIEAIYMSVITLTTVGFGAVVPATEAGKVFEAFWMLFGVVALLSVVSGCTELILALKAREKWSREDERVELDILRRRAANAAGDPNGKLGCPLRVSRAEFLRFAILQCGMMGHDEFEKIDRTFEAFNPDVDGNVEFEAIERATLHGLSRTPSGKLSVS
jgi:hypothetical protein